MISPFTVSARAMKTKNSSNMKYLMLLNVAMKLKPDFLKKKTKIKKKKKQAKKCADNMDILIRHIMKNLHLTSRR